MAGDEGLIDPSAIWIPKLKADELEATASDLVGDGEAIAASGSDIKSSWQGLQEVYSAPEAETLFSVVDPVAEDGGEIEDALAKVGDALTSFAQEARKTRQRLMELKDEAETFVKSVENEPDWRKDPEKVERHESLRIDINHQIRNYQNWERFYANEITKTFGGTHFVGRDPKDPQICKPGEQFYGVDYIPENARMPWGAPQQVDEPFWKEGVDALGDYGTSWLEGVGVIGKNAVGDRGLVYPFSPEWFDNVPGQLKGGAAFMGSLTGFYDYRTGEGGLLDWSADSFANSWQQLGNAFVPMSESDRPGYVVVQSVLNIGTLGAGVIPKLGKIARLGADAPAHGGDGPDLTRHLPDPADPAQPGNGAKLPTTKELQEQLDKFEQHTFEDYSPADAMDAAADIPVRAQVTAGGPDIQANADGPGGPGGPNDPPSDNPNPPASPTDPPSTAPGAAPPPSPGPAVGDGGGGPHGDPGDLTPFDPHELGGLPEKGDGTPEGVNRTLEQLQNPGALGADFKRDIVEDHSSRFSEMERKIAELRESRGYHVTGLHENHGEKGTSQLDTWERANPSDPGHPVEYKTVTEPKISTLKSQIASGLEKLRPRKYKYDGLANIVIDTRETLNTEDAVTGVEERLRQDLQRNSEKLGNLARLDVYTMEGDKVTFANRSIYVNGTMVRSWEGEWATP
ncbi:hypothetical protein FZ103_15905 [Streptomonospora sp. PA3]|uniref:hypothetical protein n=1 Tax=Streptomonospora sp. PA3 TaxID=2607326 RepID=UPI0012DECC33|nr:hypothetical protein [Streptomonospora sp. PA3]MUL42638.1 hypothetical protein [Streptomonospora sp. PA3]